MKTYNSKSFLLFRVFLFISVILFLSVLFFYIKDYMHFKYIQRHKFEERCLLLENSAVKMARMVHWGFVLQDRAIDSSVKMALKRFNKYYEEGEGTPYYMNLEGIKNKLAYIVGRSPEGFSLSVIDRNGVLVYSTDEKSLGLDFKKWPPFYRQIVRVFDEKKPSVDPWSRKLKDPRQAYKYGYIPTSDGLYLLSVGLFGKGVYEEGTEKFSFKKLLSTVAGQNSDLVYSAFINRNFRVINTIDGKFDDAMKNLDLDPAFIKEKVEKVQDSRENISFSVEDKKLQINFAYIDFQNGVSAASENLNMILFFVYSRSGLNDVLTERLKYSILSVGLVFLFFFLALLVFYRYIIFSLGVFGEELKEVAAGNFSSNFVHNTNFAKIKGLEMIETSINNMVYRIKKDMKELKKAYKDLEEELDLRKKVERELVLVKETLFKKVNIDELTGVFTRGHTMTCLSRELARGKEEKKNLSIIAIDIDHFKNINDVMGRSFADRILSGLGNFLVETSIEGEIDGRCGSDEFLVLLRGTSLEGAIIRAEFLRKKFSSINFDDIYVTISLGVTVLQINDSTDSLLARAEKLMVLAKENKNRVCSALK